VRGGAASLHSESSPERRVAVAHKGHLGQKSGQHGASGRTEAARTPRQDVTKSVAACTMLCNREVTAERLHSPASSMTNSTA